MTSEINLQELPDSKATALARTSARALSELLDRLPDADRARINMEGQDLIVPRQAVRLLRDILADMAQGKAVSIVPTNAELTTQQAANLLNVSRPYLIKLIESNTLPHTKVGTHRRIRFQDLVVYRQALKQQSTEAMDKLVHQAQANNMGY
jgi:excisionase family DNA binding protein